MKVTLWRGNEETGLRTGQQPVRGQPHPHTDTTPGLLERLNWDGATSSTMLSPVNVPAPAAPASECSPRAGAESPCPEPVPITTHGAAPARPELRRWAGRAQGQLRGYGGASGASLSFAGNSSIAKQDPATMYSSSASTQFKQQATNHFLLLCSSN